jgi:hypothetical protein
MEASKIKKRGYARKIVNTRYKIKQEIFKYASQVWGEGWREVWKVGTQFLILEASLNESEGCQTIELDCGDWFIINKNEYFHWTSLSIIK